MMQPITFCLCVLVDTPIWVLSCSKAGDSAKTKRSKVTQVLNFRTEKLSVSKLKALVNNEDFSSVLSLDINGNPVGAEGVDAIAQSPYAKGLQALWIDGVGAGDDGAKALAASRTVTVKELYIGFNNITQTGLASLVASEVMAKVEFLRLNYNPIGDCGAKALAQSTMLGNLQHLNLTGTKITDSGARALLGSTALRKLKFLDLSHNTITPATFHSLGEPNALPALRELEVFSSTVDTATRKWLSQNRPNLRLITLQ
jgi:Leucine-rich repeat (LRR) protein